LTSQEEGAAFEQAPSTPATTSRNKMRMVGVLVTLSAMAAATVLALVFLTGDDSSNHAAEVDRQWLAYKAKYGRSFTTNAQDTTRRAIFAENLETITTHNQQHANGLHTFSLAMNEFGHLTAEEFQSRRTGFQLTTPETVHNYTHITAPSPSIDWVARGAVTAVKDQGHCGSCYSFASTGAIEGAWQISTGDLISLSEQNIVDCSWPQGDQGCGGGSPFYAFEYVRKFGICTETSYPYIADDQQKCDGSCSSAVSISSYHVVEQSETALLAAASQQPVAVAINAGGSEFQFYHQGVYTATCTPQLNHAVLVVGYGVDNTGMEYWKVKNSWGEVWGMDGYILIQRNHPQSGGQCGIARQAFVPVV